MLDKLPEPARTVCAVAAFTGFTRSELKGLKWSDYDGRVDFDSAENLEGPRSGLPKQRRVKRGFSWCLCCKKILAKYKKAYPSGRRGLDFSRGKINASARSR